MKEGRLRVLVLTSTFPRWQGDTQPPFVHHLSSRLAEKFDVFVLAPHAPNSKSVERWGEVQVIRFRYFWPQSLERLAYDAILPNLKRNRLLWCLVPFFVAGELLAALRAARSHKIDVLHAHWVIPQGVVAAMVGWITGKPVVVTCHAADVYGLRGWFKDRLRRWALNRCSYITAVSNDLMGAVRGLGVDGRVPMAVISMGVDTGHFHPGKRDNTLRKRLSNGGPLLLFVGRLVEKKGVSYLLEAMPEVLQDFPQATLCVVGDGPLRRELETLSRSLEIDRNVLFLGALSHADLPPYYATADLFVGPSVVAEDGDTESFGLVFAEAMASNCPVVGPDVGGTEDSIIQGRTGIRVPERDAKAIAAAVRTLLGDAALADRLRAEALLWVRERFDQQSVADRYAHVISGVGNGAR